MKREIVLAIIARNQKELDERFSRVGDLGNVVHLDVMDGKFVENKSLIFNFKLPRGKKYWAHLMAASPLDWIKKNLDKLDGVIVHAESAGVDETIKFVHGRKKKIGIALNPASDVERIAGYLNEVDLVLVMTVQPGKYGGAFLPGCLKKVAELRGLGFRGAIGVDGGISGKTIARAVKSGANFFVVGSFIMGSDEPRRAFEILGRKVNT